MPPPTTCSGRHNLVEYAREHGEDLFKKCQEQITRYQIQEFEVNNRVEGYCYYRNKVKGYKDEHPIDLMLTGMQGAEPRYEFSLDEQDENNLIVTDKKTGITVQAQQVKPRKDQTQKKWRIKTEKGDYRYFNQDSLRASALRQKLRKIPIEETNIRNNVEASIFQLGYHYSNDKSRYRSLAKHKLWAYSRSLLINFVRIVNYCVKPNGQSQACLSYAVASNSLILVKYITQIKPTTFSRRNFIFHHFEKMGFSGDSLLNNLRTDPLIFSGH